MTASAGREPGIAARWAGALFVGAAAGALCAWLHTPIPWMLGPLVAVAFLRVAGAQVEAPGIARYAGQWIIGTALALYFTPAVVGRVAGAWWMLAAGAAFSIVVGYVAGFVLARIARIDRTTAIFASVPGGATEMSNLGDRFGARPDRIAAAQSLRILMVVAIIPAAFALLDLHGSDAYEAGARGFDLRGFAILMALTLAGGFALQKLRTPNAFILGPLAIGIPLSAMGIDLSNVPPVVSNLGQYLLGCALGSRFERDILEGAHRFAAGVVASVLLSIALTSAFGLALAWLSGVPAPTVVLGTAPGGIAEMGITAKVLMLGVPLVTAFHVTRVVVLLLFTAPLFAWARARWRID